MNVGKAKHRFRNVLISLTIIWLLASGISLYGNGYYYTHRDAPAFYQDVGLYVFFIGSAILLLLVFIYMLQTSKGIPYTNRSEWVTPGVNSNPSASKTATVWWSSSWLYKTRYTEWFMPKATLTLSQGLLTLGAKGRQVFQEPVVNVLARQSYSLDNELHLELPGGRSYNIRLASPRFPILDDPRFERIVEWKITLNSAGAKVV